MKLSVILQTLEQKERDVISDQRTVKMAANFNAEVLRHAREIIDNVATDDLMAPQLPEIVQIKLRPEDIHLELDRRGRDMMRDLVGPEVATTPDRIENLTGLDHLLPLFGHNGLSEAICPCPDCKYVRHHRASNKMDRRPGQ